MFGFSVTPQLHVITSDT